MKFLRLAALSLFVALLGALPAVASDSDTVTVFAAASLTDALNSAGKAYEAKTGKHVVFSFAASSALARQIEASAGADMFLSADSDWMDYLDNKGLIAHATRVNLLGNHLVLISPADLKVALKIAPHFDLAGAIGQGRLALADPASVPAGKYARAALTSLGVWDSVADHVAPAENVRAALAYVARGEAPLGVVYTTDALSEPKVRIVDTFPDSSHAPIVYPAALTKDAKPGARAFLDFLSGPDATAIFVKDGFVILKK
ncbi:MAG TPA: molybdate ABC transporter substrate-binding protein [Rhizomicrobium sp.]|nr:molybdate ABC transporter substrate-binding protein [Rhizomicrobium sp.]